MIAVVLATCNGARWLPEWLDSLRRQSVADWQLFARDDGSTDATPRLLADAARSDRRISILMDDAGRLGVTRNFGRLMQYARDSGARTVFFADQDDVWRPDKIERQQRALCETAAAVGPDAPILVHSDLTVVDERLRTLHPSHTELLRLPRGETGLAALRRLLMQNFVTGCAAAVNRPLLDLVLPLPADAVLHDWWLALCAAAGGHLFYQPEPTVLYRQHGGNAVGAGRRWQSLHPRHAQRKWHRALSNFARSTQQARALAERLHDRAPRTDPAARQLVESYCRLLSDEHSLWHRLHGLRHLDIGRPGWLNRTLLAAQLTQLRRAG